jgi:alginate O-acetyltransferase complex protein AlgI
MGSTFALVCLAWVFFRADTVSEAINYIVGFTELPTSDKPITHVVYTAFVWIGVMVLVDWLQRDGTIPRWWLNRNLQPLRWFTYGICVWLCFKNLHSEASFIYFQF